MSRGLVRLTGHRHGWFDSGHVLKDFFFSAKFACSQDTFRKMTKTRVPSAVGSQMLWTKNREEPRLAKMQSTTMPRLALLDGAGCKERNALASPPVSTVLTPLRNRVFRSVWTATRMADLGRLVQTVAIGWLMATVSASDLMVALVQAASTLPTFFLSILAGAVADNLSRLGVMFAGHCLMHWRP